MRLIAIGDVHGCLDSLEQLIEKLEVTTDDQVVFLGDYVDRGPKSVETVEYVLDFQDRFPRTVLLRGNHDEMMIQSTLYNNQEWHNVWWHNGGQGTKAQYKSAGVDIGNTARQLEAATDFVANFFFAGRNYYFGHAGFYAQYSVTDQYDDIFMKGDKSKMFDGIMWNRGHITFALEGKDLGWEDDLTVVCGHTPLTDPLCINQLVCVDTGAVFGGNLTALVVDDQGTRSFVAVKGHSK